MKEQTHSWWLKKTTTDYNMMVRLEESDENGYGKCVSCGKTIHYKQANAGHYRHGLDFVRDNIHFQGVYCNQYLSGNLAKYTLWMIDKFGRKRVEEIMNMPRKKYSIPDLQEMRAGYKKRIKEYEALL